MIELPKLPYTQDALSPHISSETIGFHYDKHHAGYVARLNSAVSGTDFEGLSLEEIVKKSFESGENSIFNNAAQIWNHTFYWESMSPSGGGDPEGDLAELVDKTFGSADKFREEFSAKAKGLFGSGWVWLVGGKEQPLEILTTKDADLPMTFDKNAILTLDVWEHAYYLDYQNLRADYINRWLENLINWEFASARI